LGRRVLRIAFRLTVTVVIALGVAFAAVLGRLYFGPIESATIARAAERVASEALGAGREAIVSQASLEFTVEQGLAIRLGDVLVGSPGEGIAVNVPTALIRLQSLPLIIGRLLPWSFEVEGMTTHVDLGRLDAGRLVSSFDIAGHAAAAATAVTGAPAAAEPKTEEAGKAAREVPDPVAGLGALGRMMAESIAHIRGEGLRSVYVRNGRVEVLLPQPATGARRTVVVGDMEIASLFGRNGADADISIGARGSIGRWSMRLRQFTERTTGERRVLFSAKDLSLPDLTGLDEPDLKFELPVDPELMLEFDRDDQVRVARLGVRLGAGIFRFGKEPEEQTLVDEGQIDVAWDRDARRFLINRLALEFGPTSFAFYGSVLPPARPDAPWQLRLDLERGVMAPRDVPGKPVSLDNAFVQAAIDPARRLVTVDNTEAHFAGTAIAARGTIDLARDPPLASFSIASAPMAAEPLKHAWPHWINAGGREWFIKNVVDGRVLASKARVAIPLRGDPSQWAKDAIYVEGRFEGGNVRPFGDLPNITGAEGRFRLENKTFETVVERAAVATSKPATLSSFRMTVPDALRKQARGSMELRGSGDAASLAEIINAEPLKVLDEAGIKQDGLQGTVEVRGRIDTTFDPDPALQNVVFKFEATTDKFASQNPILGRKFSDGQLKITVDNAGTTIGGKARIDGVATDVSLYEPADKAARERRDFAMIIDDNARARLGIELEGLVSGPMKVEIGHAGTGDSITHVAADLGGARLMLSEFGWTKGQGVPAKASFDLVKDDKGTRLDNFQVESEGMQIKGQVTLDASNQFIGADLPRFSLRKGDDGRIRITRGDKGVLNVDFDAGSFDIRGFVQALRQTENKRLPGAKKPYDLNVKVRAARLVGFSDVALSDAIIDAEVRAQTVTKLTLTARASGGRSVEIAIKPTGATRALSINSDDAGAVVAFLGLFDRMIGGQLRLRGSLDKPGNASGWLQIVGFKFAGKGGAGGVRPAQIGRDGMREVPVREAEISEEAAFDRFGLAFDMKNGIIYVSDGIAKGPATGATASGQIDLNNQKINLAGTFIPLYGLNNTISRVPILGEIFGGGRNEGLIGVTFLVVGKIEDPVLQFNPLSAIAPGMFRKIFEFRPESRLSEPG
jgi:hypothetical protein